MDISRRHEVNALGEEATRENPSLPFGNVNRGVAQGKSGSDDLAEVACHP